jgi:hypothetical protein
VCQVRRERTNNPSRAPTALPTEHCPHMIIDLITILMSIHLMGALFVLSLPKPPPFDTDDDDDDDNGGGGSDRTPPMTPWWPSGVEPFDREKELV